MRWREEEMKRHVVNSFESMHEFSKLSTGYLQDPVTCIGLAWFCIVFESASRFHLGTGLVPCSRAASSSWYFFKRSLNSLGYLK